MSAPAEKPGGTENLTPFPPGVSGNPGGRPKGLARRTREQVGNDGDKLITLWLGIMEDTQEETKDRLAASRLLAERGWGKPPTFVPIEDDDPLGLAERRADEIAHDFDVALDELARKRAERGA